MKDNWINHNTDKLMLFVLLVLGGYMVMHIVHHDQGDMQAMTWAEGAFSTILGALILILTGRVNAAHPANGDAPPIQQPSPAPFQPGQAAPTLKPVMGSQAVPKGPNS
jgi:hypothetical protein